MVTLTDKFLELTTYAMKLFPYLERVGVYAHAKDILKKTDNQLKTLSKAGLKIAYVGFESGYDLLLEEVHKNAKKAMLAIDYGESTSIAFLLETDKDISFCSCDKAAIRLISYMGLEEKSISLENALVSAGHHKTLLPRHWETVFRKCIKEGKILMVQLMKLT